MDQKESVYEHVVEWREQGRWFGTRPGERRGKETSRRFLDDCADAAQAEEAQDSALASSWRVVVQNPLRGGDLPRGG
jgi:hypothetical protein